MKAIKTWVLIADGANARVLLHSGIGHGLSEVPGAILDQPSLRGGDIMADREGRTFDSHGAGRHAMEWTSDPVREEKRHFAESVADFLESKSSIEAYDRLVVVAPPKMLGDLREAFSKSVSAKVYAEVGKDLTNTPNDEIAKHLEDTLAV